MTDSRRQFVLALAGLAGSALAGAPLLRAQNPSLDPKDQEAELPAISPRNAAKAALKEEQKEIKKKVARLYELAAELKAEVEKTDSTAVLSLNLLKKTEEIEKLARQIRSHAKG